MDSGGRIDAKHLGDEDLGVDGDVVGEFEVTFKDLCVEGFV